MKNYVLGLFCGLIFNLYAQEKPSPYGAVTNFFNAFLAKDSIAMQTVFHPKKDVCCVRLIEMDSPY